MSINEQSLKKEYELNLKKEYEEFKLFVTDSLLYLRKELELLKNNFSPDYIKIFIQSCINDYLNPQILRTINSLISVDNFNDLSNMQYTKIIQCYNIVYLSQFAYECLYSFLNNKGLTIIQNNLANFTRIKIRKDPIQEANYKNQLVKSYIDADELDKINQSQINTKILRDDAILLATLDSLTKKKLEAKNKCISTFSSFQNLDVSDLSCLKNFPESSNISMPDLKLKNRIEFCKGYLDRRLIDEQNEPSVLNIQINDQKEQVTCVDIGVNNNIVLVGMLDSSIYAYKINPEFLKQEQMELLQYQDQQYQEQSTNQIEYFKYRGHEGPITSVNLLYDEKYFLSASTDGSIRLYTILQKECLVIYKGHLNTVWSVKFGPKGYYFASGSSDCTARLWATDRLSSVRLFIGHKSDVVDLEFLQNNNYLLTISFDGLIKFWDINTGNCVRILFHNSESISCITTSLSGLYMATGSQDGSVILWDLVKGKVLSQFYVEENNFQLKKNKPNKINSVHFSVDDISLVCTTDRKLAFYVVNKLKEETAVDAFSGFSQELDLNGILSGNIEQKFEPLNFFDNQGSEQFIAAKFNSRNLIVNISKNK